MSHDRKPGRVRPVSAPGGASNPAGATAIAIGGAAGVDPAAGTASAGQGLLHMLLFFAGSAVGGALMEILYR